MPVPGSPHRAGSRRAPTPLGTPEPAPPGPSRPLPSRAGPQAPAPAPVAAPWLPTGATPGLGLGWGRRSRQPPAVGTPPGGVWEGGMWVQVAPCSAGAPSAVGHSGGSGALGMWWGAGEERWWEGEGWGAWGCGGRWGPPGCAGGVGVGPPEAPTQAVSVPLFGGSAQCVGTPLQSASGCRDSSVWGDPTERRAQQGPPPGPLRAGGGRRGPAVLSGGGGMPGSVLALVCAGSPVLRGRPVPPAGHSRVTSGVSVITPGARPTVPVPG